MILTLIIVGLMELVNVILGVMPTLPAIPSTISDGGAWVITAISGVVGILNYIYSPTLLAAVVGVIVLLLSFDTIYHTAMWVIRKIPYINVH